MGMSDLPGYLTSAEAAAALGLTIRRVRQMCAELGAVKFGREWVFPAREVEKAKKAGRPKRGWPKGRSRA